LKESIIVNLLIEDLRNNEIFSTNNGVMTVEVDTKNPTVPAQRLVDVLEGLGNTINCYEHGLSAANSVLKPWTHKDPQVT
jgi:hypothetical protein